MTPRVRPVLRDSRLNSMCRRRPRCECGRLIHIAVIGKGRGRQQTRKDHGLCHQCWRRQGDQVAAAKRKRWAATAVTRGFRQGLAL